MSVFERCPSYRESTKIGKERLGPTTRWVFWRGVLVLELSVKRELTVFIPRVRFLYKMTDSQQGASDSSAPASLVPSIKELNGSNAKVVAGLIFFLFKLKLA